MESSCLVFQVKKLLNLDQWRKHLNWAKEKKDWTVSSGFLMKGKCTLQLEIKVGGFGGRLVRSRKHFAWGPEGNLQSVKIWGLMSRITAAVYQKVPQAFMFPSAVDLDGDAGFILQQYPAHTIEVLKMDMSFREDFILNNLMLFFWTNWEVNPGFFIELKFSEILFFCFFFWFFYLLEHEFLIFGKGLVYRLTYLSLWNCLDAIIKVDTQNRCILTADWLKKSVQDPFSSWIFSLSSHLKTETDRRMGRWKNLSVRWQLPHHEGLIYPTGWCSALLSSLDTPSTPCVFMLRFVAAAGWEWRLCHLSVRLISPHNITDSSHHHPFAFNSCRCSFVPHDSRQFSLPTPLHSPPHRFLHTFCSSEQLSPGRHLYSVVSSLFSFQATSQTTDKCERQKVRNGKSSNESN